VLEAGRDVRVMSISTLATEPLQCRNEALDNVSFFRLQDPEPVSTLPVGGEARSLLASPRYRKK